MEQEEVLLGARLNDQSPQKLIEHYYSNYYEYYFNNIKKVEEIFSRCKQKKYTIGIWGTGEKGRTFLYVIDKLNLQPIKYVYDSDEGVVGNRMDTGQNILKYNDNVENIDVLLVMGKQYYNSVYKECYCKIPYIIDLDMYIKYSISCEELMKE
jgi:hypothetical protein